MSDQPTHRKKGGLAKRLFRAVGQAGTAVGGVAGGLLRSAGQTAKNAGGRAALTFSKDVDSTTQTSLRELAESLTQWLVQEHQGKADLQQQKPSTVELSELGQVSTLYEVVMDEPGLLGRKFRFVFREKPLLDYQSNFGQTTDQVYDEQALIVLSWPQNLTKEAKNLGVIVWDKASLVGRRNPAHDLAQKWLADFAGGTFPSKRVAPKTKLKEARTVPLFGRKEELALAQRLVLSPRDRTDEGRPLISLAAPGGTGKSYFLKALKAQVGHRVLWTGVDHQGMAEESSGAGFLGRILAQLAQGLEEQSVDMSNFGKELRSFKKQLEQEDGEPTGFFAHIRKAAETAAGINPILGAVSAGVVFLTSWGQQAKEESEALARDNAVKALTDAFKTDLARYTQEASSESLCWRRPVIVFDTYEWLAPLVDTWMRIEFLADDFLNETKCVVVLSGREHLLRTDTRWSEWQHMVTNVTLGSFDRAISFEYLESLGVDKERWEPVYEMTEGLPLFLSLATHISEADQAVSILSERVLEEVSAEHHEQFLKASLLHSIDRQSVAQLFSEASEEEVVELTKRLTDATFTVAQDGKRAFLPPVRRILRKALILEHGQSRVSELEASLAERSDC